MCEKSHFSLYYTNEPSPEVELHIYYLLSTSKIFYANDLKNLNLKLFQINLVQLNN